MQPILFSETGDATLHLVSGTQANLIQRLWSQWRQPNLASHTDAPHFLMQRLKEARPATYIHCVRVARLASATGRAVGFSSECLKQLSLAAMLHDVGKVLMPQCVLSTPRRLNLCEHALMRLHPSLGAMLISHFGLDDKLRVRTRHHHERWDGKGYPNRLSGEAIPCMARIIHVCDTYDAMTIQRPYNKPATHDEAITEIRRCSGSQFDPRMVEAFLDARVA